MIDDPKQRTVQAPASHPPAALLSWVADTLPTLALERPRGDLVAACTSLQAEASHRRFYRLELPGQSLVIMQSPPALEQNDQFERLASVFATAGVAVPEVLAHERGAGYLLLTDLGPRHLLDAYRDGAAAAAIHAAIDHTLPRIAAIDSPHVPPYTPGRLSDELDIFVDFLVRAAAEVALPDRLFEPVRQHLLAAAAAQPSVCVHRDFHCRNLLVLANAAPGVGVLDFQDALHGPAAYDLASLLHDCYWRFDEPTIDHYVDRAAARLPGIHRRGVDLLAIQRQLKALGIFARLHLRDAKSSHLVHIEPVLARVSALCAAQPECRALASWLQETLEPAVSAWLRSL